MKKKIVYALINGGLLYGIIIFTGWYYTQEQVTTVYNFNILDRYLPFLDKNSLVIFDIDRVLLIEADPWERGHRDDRKQARTIATLFVDTAELAQQLDRKTRDYVWSIYAQTLQEVVLDDHIVHIIRTLQAKGVKVIALTRFLVGNVGNISALEDLRIHQLKSVGIDFSSSFPQHGYLVFDQFSFENKHPVFKNGVLFTTLACSKGALLQAFFEKIGWYPQRVIMFDDKMDNHISVQDMLAQLHISYRGFLFLRALQLPAYFDKDIAELQMQYLLDHHEWITADQARQLIK